MMYRAGVFCHNGLGDGINCLVLSNNLHLNGWQVDTYQNTISSLQNWIPHLPVLPYPPLSALPKILNTYDHFFVVQNDASPFVQKLIEEGKRRFPEKIKVIYLYPSPSIINEPYYTDCLTNPSLPVAENLRLLAEKVLHLPKITKSSGLIPLPNITPRKYPKRVVIHPTSARETRNWPKEKFLQLAAHLKTLGFEPVFIPGAHEGWEETAHVLFSTLDELARYLYESGLFIGNDSGPGHLASALGLPTLTICRRKALANLWAPSFQKGIALTPSPFIPNIRGLRLRDRYWQKFITVNMALKAFDRLLAVVAKPVMTCAKSQD